MYDSLRPLRLHPTRFLCPWDSPGKNTGEGCHSLLWGIFLTQGSNPGVQHCRQILYHLSHHEVNIIQLPILQHLRRHNKEKVTWAWLSFPGGSVGKESASNAGNAGRRESDPWVGKFPWRKAWQPTPVFLPRESHGQRSLVGYSP